MKTNSLQLLASDKNRFGSWGGFSLCGSKLWSHFFHVLKNRNHPKSCSSFFILLVVFSCQSLQAEAVHYYPLTVRNFTGVNLPVTFGSFGETYIFPAGVSSLWVHQTGDSPWYIDAEATMECVFALMDESEAHQVFYELTVGGNGVPENFVNRTAPFEKWDLYRQSSIERRWQWTTGFCFAGLLLSLGFMFGQGKNVILKNFTHT